MSIKFVPWCFLTFSTLIASSRITDKSNRNKKKIETTSFRDRRWIIVVFSECHRFEGTLVDLVRPMVFCHKKNCFFLDRRKLKYYIFQKKSKYLWKLLYFISLKINCTNQIKFDFYKTTHIETFFIILRPVGTKYDVLPIHYKLINCYFYIWYQIWFNVAKSSLFTLLA